MIVHCWVRIQLIEESKNMLLSFTHALELFSKLRGTDKGVAEKAALISNKRAYVRNRIELVNRRQVLPLRHFYIL